MRVGRRKGLGMIECGHINSSHDASLSSMGRGNLVDKCAKQSSDGRCKKRDGKEENECAPDRGFADELFSITGNRKGDGRGENGGKPCHMFLPLHGKVVPLGPLGFCE